jgi:hypothetical protein
MINKYVVGFFGGFILAIVTAVIAFQISFRLLDSGDRVNDLLGAYGLSLTIGVIAWILVR